MRLLHASGRESGGGGVVYSGDVRWYHLEVMRITPMRIAKTSTSRCQNMYLSTNHQPQRQRPSLIATTMPVPPASSEAPAPTLPVSLRPRAPIPALVRRELEYTGYQGMPGKTYEESCALCDASGDFSCSMTCFQRWIMQLFRQLTRLFLCIAHQMIRQIYRPHQLRTSQTLTYSISPLRPLPIYGNIHWTRS